METKPPAAYEEDGTVITVERRFAADTPIGELLKRHVRHAFRGSLPDSCGDSSHNTEDKKAVCSPKEEIE